MRSSACSSPSPGGTRQSTFSRARDGITLIFSEALTIVGVSVTPSIGSSRIAIAGFTDSTSASAFARSSSSTPIASRNASGSGERSGVTRAARERLQHRARAW